MTKQRALILQVIRESGQHLTAEEIYQAAKKQMPNIAQATVYNNLLHLAAAGEIRRISIQGEKDRYDKTDVPHIHAICEGCGKIWDHPSEGLLQKLEQEMGVPIHYYELAVHCKCKDCASNVSN
ncbi:MAG: transcriptional repressor [Clostridia bacterium]|nr:transcriptional repressor [Clostridia bacterium]